MTKKKIIKLYFQGSLKTTITSFYSRNVVERIHHEAYSARRKLGDKAFRG